jgi:hypothetical protein
LNGPPGDAGLPGVNGEKGIMGIDGKRGKLIKCIVIKIMVKNITYIMRIFKIIYIS